MHHPARTFGYVFGAIYALVGVVGFVLTGLSGFAATQGPELFFFEINPLHNIVHLGIGAALLYGAITGERMARAITGTVAGTYLVVGILGFFVTGTELNILALNTADHFLHLATAAVGIYAATRSATTVTDEERVLTNA